MQDLHAICNLRFAICDRRIAKLQIANRKSPMRSRGFTFVELCFGLVITSLVMGAVAAFTMAMAQSWKHSDQVETTAVKARQASVRLVRTVQEAKLIGAVEQGGISGTPSAPAAVLLWIRDTNGDGSIQGSECAMIEHDLDDQILRFYPSGQGNSTTVLPWATFSATGVLANFKAGRTSYPIAGGVKAVRFAAFATTGATERPTLEYTLLFIAKGTNAGQIDHAGRTLLEYGTCVIRAPAKQPA